MGGILTLKIFLDTFPMINPDAADISQAESSTRATYQGIAVASYNLGCFIGAVITIFIGNPLGRKRMILLGTAIMVVGAALQASATTLEHFIIGRIITGLGNGGNTSTVRNSQVYPRSSQFSLLPHSTWRRLNDSGPGGQAYRPHFSIPPFQRPTFQRPRLNTTSRSQHGSPSAQRATSEGRW